ncbi:MAG TPA: Ig-like domain-containing protein [Longimicrobium sp.]|nr:Ig-like domain-containing protein [Longimicrobium sp.]
MTWIRPSRGACVAALLVLAACADREGAGVVTPAPAAPAAPPDLQRVACVGSRTEIRCESPAHGGARGDLTLGGQGTYVRLASAAPSYAGGSLTFFVTVQNLLGQAIGTVDGSTVAPTGVRVFFASAPVVTQGTGTVTVVGDGTAAFTAGAQPYYQYAQIVAPGATSAPRKWRLDFPATVTTFTFTLYVSAPVRYPDGWVDLGAAALTLPRGGAATLQPVVRDRFGRAVDGAPPVALASSAPAVATVSNGGAVAALSAGTSTVTATSGALTGSVPVTVTAPSGLAFLNPTPATVLSGLTLQFTLTLLDSAFHALPTAGRVIAWSSSDTTRARINATGLLTAVAPGTAVITASFEGRTLTSNLTVTTAAAGVVQLAQVAAGANHTCGVTAGGKAYCWGPNLTGQLGNGQIGATAAFYRNTPAAVSGGLTFASISSGASRSCGVTADHAAYCWGNNDFGALGKGDTVHAVVPTPVSGGIQWAVVAASRDHGCGLDTAGQAWCWGHNHLGQLGNGGGADSHVPVPVLGSHTFASISSTWDHTCAVDTGGAAWCWGYNLRGALGDATFTTRAEPARVYGGISFASVSAGMGYTCGVSTGGAGYCWGDNSFSNLGNGGLTSPESSAVPVPVSGGITWASMAAGPRFATCGVAVGGAAFCWGRNDGAMLLGAGGIGSSTVPARVGGAVAFASLSAGGIQTCGVTTGGYGYCWGPAQTGALGDGTFTSRAFPIPVLKGEVP